MLRFGHSKISGGFSPEQSALNPEHNIACSDLFARVWALGSGRDVRRLRGFGGLRMHGPSITTKA